MTTRHTRARARLAAFAALTMLATAVATQPAAAEYTGWDPGGGGADGGGGSVTRRADVFCHEGDAWMVTGKSSDRRIPGYGGKRGSVWLLRPNNMCPNHAISAPRAAGAPGGSYEGEIIMRQVAHGWEVWRFYGTPQTVQGVTVSYAGVPTWGSDAEVITVVPHPDDHRTVPSGTLPWRQQAYVSTGRDPITLFAGGAPTTNPPFRFRDQRCSSLIPRQDPVARAMASNPSGTRATLFESYQDVTAAAGVPDAWRIGIISINARNTGPIGSPESILIGDSRPCTSPFEYATYTPAEGLSLEGVSQGVCVIPLTRVQLRLTDGSWATMRSLSHRYSTSYGRQNDYPLWRQALYDEIQSRSNSPYMLDGDLRPNDRGATPSQPSGTSFTRYNKQQAAETARDHASCRNGFRGLEGLGEPEGTGGADPRLTLMLEVPEVFQVGGELRPNQTVRVRHTPYTCEGGLPCPERRATQPVSRRNLPLTPDHLSQISYRLQVSANGLALCQSNNPAERCDWRLSGPAGSRGETWSLAQPAGEPRSPSAQQTAASNWERVQTSQTLYFSATNPGESVTARITDVSARYATYAWASRQIGVTSCVNHVDGAPRGTTTGAPSQGDLRRRWDSRTPYFATTPGGTVSQYTLNPVFRDEIVRGPTGQPLLNPDGSVRTRSVFDYYDPPTWHTMPLWVCSRAVLDDWEVSTEREIPSAQIRVATPESRSVIGVISR
jgi:hypothetical protein